jgi:hypothetical protein
MPLWAYYVCYYVCLTLTIWKTLDALDACLPVLGICSKHLEMCEIRLLEDSDIHQIFA